MAFLKPRVQPTAFLDMLNEVADLWTNDTSPFAAYYISTDLQDISAYKNYGFMTSIDNTITITLLRGATIVFPAIAGVFYPINITSFQCAIGFPLFIFSDNEKANT